MLVDTSAWVDFFNGFDSPQGRAVATLLAGDDEPCTCGLVVAEVLQGLRRSRAPIEAIFRRMTVLEPVGLDTYVRAAELFRALRARGVTVRSTIDCLIAVLAADAEAALLARDRDLDAIVRSGLVRLESWA